ncbi:MAG TPA: NIPSNAP family protein [Rhodoblastus sp.]|mgnify:CR=1 FL=1|nr:NIPSNAP family protein [Rhodoblastus sp.]
MITCFIRYEIEPFAQEQFEDYARVWGEAIPRCGADLVGYFGPHEGSATTAYGIYDIADLAAYEAYRAKLRADPAGRANFDFARREKFIRREDRIFLRRLTPPRHPTP